MDNVFAVIVNWNNSEITLNLVDALKNQTLHLEVVVIDNGSSDNSVLVLKKNNFHRFVLIENSANEGFGSGCNIGIKYALNERADYIWLINNDAKPEQNCAYELLAVAKQSKDIGIVGGSIEHPHNLIPSHCGSVVSPFLLQSRYVLDEKLLSINRYGFITGACMFLNAEIFKKGAGLFDANYFMYWEDLDFCIGVKKLGFSLKVAHKAIVMHTPGTSSNSIPISRYEWQLDSAIYWIKKHYPFKFYALLIIFLRNILKSIVDGNMSRLYLTLKKFF